MNKMKNPATHVSYAVSSIKDTIAFYTDLFESAPVKVKPDYAKFELEDPALVISFIQSPDKAKLGLPGAHFGIRLGTAEEVIKRREQLERASYALDVEEDVSCCYALQDKFWVKDPDGVRWEIYTFKGDTEELQSDTASGCCNDAKVDSEKETATACC